MAQKGNNLEEFAEAFKSYMGVMPLVAAALAPLLTFLKALHAYESQKTTLATLSGILGFLLLAWVFYVRRTIALGSVTKGPRFIFNLLPFLLIVGAISCFVAYSHALEKSVNQALEDSKGLSYKVDNQAYPFTARSDVLQHWGDDHVIPDSTRLQLLYLGIFLCPESAFVVMALREYINTKRNLSELEWMFGTQDGKALEKIQALIEQQAKNPEHQCKERSRS